MKNRAPIQDAIDLRNFKQDLASTVIKRSRVHFITEDESKVADEEAEILERILAQNELDEEETQEVEEATGGHYGLMDEPDLDFSNIPEDVLSVADEILARLQREAEEDNEARRVEWTEKIVNGDM